MLQPGTKRKEGAPSLPVLVDGHGLAMRQARIACQTLYKRVSKPTGHTEAAERVGHWMRRALIPPTSVAVAVAVAPRGAFAVRWLQSR
jgi:hypothetical protein